MRQENEEKVTMQLSQEMIDELVTKDWVSILDAKPDPKEYVNVRYSNDSGDLEEYWIFAEFVPKNRTFEWQYKED